MIIDSEIVVVLVNFNNNQDTVECVRSISSSRNIENPFVVIVDNGSLKMDIKEQVEFYDLVHVIYSQKNLGFGKANNLGIEWALKNLNAKYFFILNNDTILREDTIQTLIEKFPQDSSYVMVSPKILTYESNSKIWYAGGFFEYKKMSVTIPHFGEPDKPVSSQSVEFASGCAMFFRADYFKNNSGFDPQIFMYDEDVELCLRISRNNQRIFFVGDALLYHKCQGSQNEETPEKKELNQLHPNSPGVKFYLRNTISNRYYIVNKYFRGWNNLKIKIWLTWYWLMKAIQYLLYGKIQLVTLTLSKIIAPKK